MKDETFFKNVVEKGITETLKKIYPDARDIKVTSIGANFFDTLSEAYCDDSGSVPDVVSDYINRMRLRINVDIDHKKGGR
jgi:hypothetical protein